MSTTSTFLTEFNAWIKADPARAAKLLGTYPSIVERWIAGTHKPSIDIVERFHNDIKGHEAELLTAGDAPTTQKKKKAPTPPKEAPTCPTTSGDKEDEAISDMGGMPSEPTPAKPHEPPPAKSLKAKPGSIAPWKQEPEWEGRNLAVLFPCYRLTNPATAWTLVAIALDLGKEKVFFDMELGDAMIYHARNKLATRFVESEREWSLWIDDDIIAPIGRSKWFKYMGRLPEDYPDAIAERHVVHRLIGHKKTVVGGTYFGRQPGGPPMFSDMYRPDAVRDARAMKDGLRSMEWVATGCLLVHRSVYLDIQKKFPELAPDEHRKEWDFFLPETGKGEDVAFCARARAAGHDVFVDTGLQCLHVGWASYGAHNTNTPQ